MQMIIVFVLLYTVNYVRPCCACIMCSLIPRPSLPAFNVARKKLGLATLKAGREGLGDDTVLCVLLREARLKISVCCFMYIVIVYPFFKSLYMYTVSVHVFGSWHCLFALDTL